MPDLNAPIRDVTVYSDRALVTRRGTLHLEAGEHELRVNNLPQFLRESLRANGQGPEGTRILDVDITTAFHSRLPETELLTLQTEIDLLRQKRELLQARQGSLQDRRKWLRSLGEQSHDFARGLAQGQMKPEDCSRFFNFMTEQALRDAEEAQQLQVQVQQVEQEIAAKEREMAQKQGYTQTDRLAAVVTVALAEAGDVELEISYIVFNASWYPQYDVRVHMAEDGNSGTVELTYVGMVQQGSGEAWEGVQLALSTARPSLASVLPELQAWYLDVPAPPRPPMPVAAPAPMMRAMAPGAAYGASAASDEILYSTSEAAPKIARRRAPAAVETATVEHTGTALVFRVGRSVDIPSDNSPHKTTIAQDNLPCELDYVSAPVLEEQTHLRATVTNTTERILLKGDASIFLGGEYVGTTEIKQTASNEKYKIFLGLDDTIKVKRELLERSVDKGNLLQSDLRRITYAYRITVHNYAAYPRKVVVQDHLPVSKHERIKIRVQNIQPAPSERTGLEVLTWNVTLKPDGEQLIDYRFVVEHPRDLHVIGLQE